MIQKITLTRTIARSVLESSTKDFTDQHWKFRFGAHALSRARPPLYGIDKRYLDAQTPVKAKIVDASMDSSLEAFSHNPTDDSFAALPAQATALPII